jgi:hypothetical protein
MLGAMYFVHQEIFYSEFISASKSILSWHPPHLKKCATAATNNQQPTPDTCHSTTKNQQQPLSATPTNHQQPQHFTADTRHLTTNIYSTTDRYNWKLGHQRTANEKAFPEAGVLKKLSLASFAKLSRLSFSWLRIGLASVSYPGLGVHDGPCTQPANSQLIPQSTMKAWVSPLSLAEQGWLTQSSD